MTRADGPSRLLVRDIAQLVTPSGTLSPLRGRSLGDVEVLEDAYVLCEDGLVSAVGRMRELRELGGDIEGLDARGMCAIPGLVDCHTHACFGGDRVEEFSLRAAGASYEELHAAGGGILSTVRATREAGREGLREAVRRHRGWMLAAGTTTFEAKSGYGLDRETEIASLEVIREEGGIPTFLGAHTVPPEFDDADEYVDFLLAEVLPAAAGVAEAADVFVERGAFDVAQARRYLEACREAGLAPRLHGDQFTELGAVQLAVDVGARSVDHLEATGEVGIGTLAASDVIGVLLPASALFLDRPMPQARSMVEAGVAIALATDFNPGTSPCLSMPEAISVAASLYRLPPLWAIGAATINAAWVLGLEQSVGSLEPGKRADFVVLDAEDLAMIPYRPGHNPVAETWIAGQQVWTRG